MLPPIVTFSTLFFVLACVTSLVLTALVRELAPRVGLTDKPDGRRKLHEGAMPLGGGVAIFLATIAVLGVVMVQDNPFQRSLWEHRALSSLSVLLLASAIIVVLGLVDDRIGLKGRNKLAGQFVAASILAYGTPDIQSIGLFGGTIPLGEFGIVFKVVWLLGAINALNLLDGIDGLATTIGIILVTTIAVMAAMLDRTDVAIIAVVFAGALVGFMRFNFPPATIFLGDTGSMLIGLMVGTLAIQGSLKGAGTVLLAAPLAVWTIPIFDSVAAILRRKLTGRSIYATDRSHLHHRLLSLLGSNRKVLVWVAVACALTSGAALASVVLRERMVDSNYNDLIALLACAAIIVIFITTGVFGRAEMLLLGSRLRRVGRLLTPRIGAARGQVREVTIGLQGTRKWETLWATLTEAAEKLRLVEIRMDVKLPTATERQVAHWQQQRTSARGRRWRVRLPIMLEGHSVGHILAIGVREDEAAGEGIQYLLDLVDPFEDQLAAIAADDGEETTSREIVDVEIEADPVETVTIEETE